MHWRTHRITIIFLWVEKRYLSSCATKQDRDRQTQSKPSEHASIFLLESITQGGILAIGGQHWKDVDRSIIGSFAKLIVRTELETDFERSKRLFSPFDKRIGHSVVEKRDVFAASFDSLSTEAESKHTETNESLQSTKFSKKEITLS